jgi:hypothetical protein
MSKSNATNQLAASSSSSIGSALSAQSNSNVKNRPPQTNFIEKNKNLSRFKSGGSKLNNDTSNSIVIRYLNDVDSKKINLKATYSVQNSKNNYSGKENVDKDDENEVAKLIIESEATLNDQAPADVDISIISNHSSIVTDSRPKLISDFFIKTAQTNAQFTLPPIQSEQFKEPDTKSFDIQDEKLESILRKSENCDLLRSVLFTDEHFEKIALPITQTGSTYENENKRAFTPPVNEKSIHVLEQGNQYQYSPSKAGIEATGFNEFQNDDEVNILEFDTGKYKFRSEFLQK